LQLVEPLPLSYHRSVQSRVVTKFSQTEISRHFYFVISRNFQKYFAKFRKCKICKISRNIVFQNQSYDEILRSTKIILWKSRHCGKIILQTKYLMKFREISFAKLCFWRNFAKFHSQSLQILQNFGKIIRELSISENFAKFLSQN